MYAGLGANVLDNPVKTRWGFNFTYGADLFLVKPLVLSLELDAGTLGKVGAFHARGTAGVLWRGWEVFTGYDYRRIGPVDLQGPVAGVRLWF